MRKWFVLAILPVFLGMTFAREFAIEDRDVLRKAFDLENWGFLDAAEHWYHNLSESKNPKVRYRAFCLWAAILKRRGKIVEEMAVLEKMIDVFPRDRQNKKRRQALYRYYLANWQWSKVQKMARTIMKKDRPNENDKLGKMPIWIDAWKKRTSEIKWRETFDRPFSWSLGHPTFYRVDSLRRCLDATTVTGTWYHAGKFFDWQGGSSTLSFDIQIKNIEWTGLVSFGLVNAKAKSRIRIVANFSCSGGGGDLHYGLSLHACRVGVGKIVRSACRDYQTGMWYHVELDYLKEICQVRLRVWKQESEELVGEQIAKLPGPLPQGVYFVGFARCSRNKIHPFALAQAAVDNIQITGGKWQKYKQENNPIYDYNLQARQNPQETIERYTALLKKYPKSWRALEMRAYLWKSLGNSANCRLDIERLLRLNPNHPSKSFLLNLSKKR